MSQTTNSEEKKVAPSFRQQEPTVSDGTATVPAYAVALGFTGPELANFGTGQVSFEAVMPVSEAAELFAKICTTLRVPSQNQQRLIFFNSMIEYFIVNGTSPKQKPSTDIIIAGKKYSASDILAIIGPHLRRFARAYADRAYDLLRSKPSLAQELAVKRGWDIQLKYLCFDFSLFVTNLPPAVADAIRRQSIITIRGSNKRAEQTFELEREQVIAGKEAVQQFD